MRTEPLVIAGLAGPLVIARSELTGRYSVTVGGQPVPGTRQREYQLPTADGQTVTATVHRSNLLDPFPTVEIGGTPHRTGPPVPAALMILSASPAALAVVGGLIGGVVGALAIVANLRIVRRAWPTAVRAVLMTAVLIMAAVTWLVAAATINAAFAAP